jgi:hypothetical protein
VSHPQAFHTSCRSGLGGISGFQINAASRRLDAQQLAALAGAHARYSAPHDLPYEPTPEQMGEFPVALKMSVVPSVGPVVSRTVYVGREYRGADGHPDEGRFGNYFCHMVVGRTGEDPFDGLAAVELWDASHWTTDESRATELSDLGPLSPGPLDVAGVLDAVAAAPEGVAAALVDRALRAMDGGSPLLIVDPVVSRAVVWLAWITFALPPRLARALTFSTFEGRPGDGVSLHVVATTPACDGGGAVAGRFERVDVTRPVTGDSPMLYARVAAALAEQETEALVSAVRRVTRESPAARGAALAIAGGRTDLAGDDDLPVVLAELITLVQSGRATEAAAAAAALVPSEPGDRAVIADWAALYAAARSCASDDGARELASIALLRILAHEEALNADVLHARSDAPTAPAVAGIGAWVRATEAAQGSDRSGHLLRLGVNLGLLGLNVPVDGRAAAVIVADLHRESTQRALSAIAADGALGHVVARVTEIVAGEPAGSPTTRARLLALTRYPDARDAIRARAERLQTFDAHATWQRARVETGLATAEQAARELAPKAVDEGARSEIRELWGPTGPRTESQLNGLLLAYLDTGSPVPSADCDRAFRTLMLSPLPQQRPPASSIGFTLGRLEGEVRRRGDFWAWATTWKRPGLERTTLEPWSRGATLAFRDEDHLVPDERWNELAATIAATLVSHRRDPDFVTVLDRFGGAEFETLCVYIGRALERELEASPDRLIFAAREFVEWRRIPGVPRLVDAVLPTAFEGLSARDVEDVGVLIGPALIQHWNTWAQVHPRTGARAKVARAFRRRGKDRAGDQA